MKKLNGKELEPIGSTLMLIGGLLVLTLPLKTIWDLVQNTSVSSFPIEETLLAILAVIGCVIIWKGGHLAGGVMGIIVGLLILRSSNFEYRSFSAVLIILGGMVGLVARFWLYAELSSERVSARA